MLAKVSFPYHLPIIFLGSITLIFGLFSRRFFCNLCPYGSFVGLFNKLNFFKLNKNNELCTKCGACYEACPMRLKQIYLEDEKSDVSNSKCLYCGECVKKCPKDDVLYITCKGKIVVKSSTKEFLKNNYPDLFKEDNEHES